MKKIIFYFCIIFFTKELTTTYAQCSDAGVCQLGSVSHGEERKSILQISYNNGYSGKDDDVTFHSIHFTAQYSFFAESYFNLIVPYNFQSGPRGNVNGIGDLIVSWNQELISSESSILNVSAGIKLATGDENLEPLLPQVYQPGLGSTDFIFALDYHYENFNFGAGYQLAGGRNDKTGIKLKRGDDLMFRSSYSLLFNSFSLTPQFLFIKRLSKSTILDPGFMGSENFIEVDGSDQSQLNFITSVQYDLTENYAVTFEAAIPFLQRDVNVDGLKRAYTASIGMKFLIE